MTKALAVFEVDSQKGSAMTKKSARPFLEDADRRLARTCVEKLGPALGLPVKALDGGANLLIPNSLGATEDAPRWEAPDDGKNGCQVS